MVTRTGVAEGSQRQLSSPDEVSGETHRPFQLGDRMSVRSVSRPLAAALSLGLLALVAAATPPANPQEADAASCVRINGGVWNPAGNENYMPYLDNEYITIRNYCSTYRTLTGWRVHDYGSKHTYYFPSGFRIYPGYNVKLRSGTGTNTKYTLYWKRTYGAVWNNSAPEKAYLQNSAHTTVSTWTIY
jgi:Lamin Tail Domain